MFKSIIVAVDGSETSFKAAKVAGDMARCTVPDELMVIVCYEPLLRAGNITELEAEVGRRVFEAREVYHKAVEVIGEIGVRVTPEILEGPAAEAILNVADVRKSDLIVMGTRGLGHLAGLVLGSQSMKVVTNAPCPVLIVK